MIEIMDEGDSTSRCPEQLLTGKIRTEKCWKVTGMHHVEMSMQWRVQVGGEDDPQAGLRNMISELSVQLDSKLDSFKKDIADIKKICKYHSSCSSR